MGRVYPLLNNKKNGIHPNCKIWRSPKGQTRKGRVGRVNQPKSPPIAFVVSKLAERNMLPAIYFIFSRKGCDRAIQNVKDLSLVNYQECNLITQELDKYSRKNQEGINDKVHFEALKRGIASHHAGLLPAWKELIEDLFQKGLIKIVFATETLAAGINMPARTTVISSLSKRTEDGHRILSNSEFLQMSGRAGRRGKDTQGFVVAVQNRFEGAKEASELALSKPNPLISQFTPSYGMVLNLLQNYDIEKSRELIKRSFGNYIYFEESSKENNNLKILEKELDKLKEITKNISWQDFDSYEKLNSRLKEERRLLRILEKQASKRLSEEISLAVKFIKDGSLISIKAPQLNRKIVPAVILKKIYYSRDLANLLCLTFDNTFILIKPSYIVNIFPDKEVFDISKINLPEINFLGETLRGDYVSKEISDSILQISKIYDLKIPKYDLESEVVMQNRLIRNLEKEIINEPAHTFGDIRKLKKFRKRIVAIEKEISIRNKNLQDKENYNWKKFTDLKEILNQFGCLENLELTDIGKSVGSIRTENELWVGLVLLSGYLDDLTPPDLASIIQSISVDTRRPDVWTNFKSSVKVDEVLFELEGLRKLLTLKQNQYFIEVPIILDRELTGIISEWAKGKKWKEIIFNTSLDEGDVVRIVRRTIDILSQVQYCIGVSNKLKKNARLALKAINRFPVKELEDLKQASDDPEINPATKRLDN